MAAAHAPTRPYALASPNPNPLSPCTTSTRTCKLTHPIARHRHPRRPCADCSPVHRLLWGSIRSSGWHYSVYSVYLVYSVSSRCSGVDLHVRCERSENHDEWCQLWRLIYSIFDFRLCLFAAWCVGGAIIVNVFFFICFIFLLIIGKTTNSI